MSLIIFPVSSVTLRLLTFFVFSFILRETFTRLVFFSYCYWVTWHYCIILRYVSSPLYNLFMFSLCWLIHNIFIYSMVFYTLILDIVAADFSILLFWHSSLLISSFWYFLVCITLCSLVSKMSSKFLHILSVIFNNGDMQLYKYSYEFLLFCFDLYLIFV